MQCFNVALTDALTDEEAATVAWLLRETYEPEKCTADSQLAASASAASATTIIEVGPRLTFSTAWSANAVSACEGCGIDKVARLERSRRYAVEASGGGLSEAERVKFAALVHDRMTEEVYATPLRSFEVRCCMILFAMLWCASLTLHMCVQVLRLYSAFYTRTA